MTTHQNQMSLIFFLPSFTHLLSAYLFVPKQKKGLTLNLNERMVEERMTRLFCRQAKIHCKVTMMLRYFHTTKGLCADISADKGN